MIDRSYLLKYLKSGDRILLYGKGRNVQLNYEYLKGQRQFRLVGIMTSDADRIIDPKIPMYDPDQLKTLPPSSYDKVIITVRDQKLGIKMYQSILRCGVGREKIVAAHIYVGPTTDIALEDFINNPALLRREIQKFIEQKYGSLHYFDPLIQELGKKNNEHDALCEQFAKVSGLLPPLENIVFLYVSYLAGIFNADLMKCLAMSALQIDHPELRLFLHGILYDELSMCFLHEGYRFPEYYTFRRSCIEKLCKMYDFQIQMDKIGESADGRIHKILIINNELRNRKHAITLISVQLSRILAELGYEVRVMPLDIESHISWEIPIFCPVHSMAYYNSREFEEYHKTAYHPNVTIEYVDAVDAKERMQIELNRIAAFSPDLIFDMSTETSIISYIYSKHFLTLCYPLAGYQSSTYFTYFVAKDKDTFLRENSKYGSVNEDCVIEYPSLCILPPNPAHTYTRADFLIDENDFVLVTVGNRLSIELTKDFVDMVCKTLLIKPNIKWVVIGSKNEYLTQTYANYVASCKIICIEYEEDLPAFYKICNLYLNPQRMGGGASIYWAMCCGLPIAMLSAPSDIAPIVGDENTIGNTYAQMMEYALELWRDPEFYQTEKEKFQKRAEFFTKKQMESVQNLIHTVEKLQDNRGNS